MKIKEKKKLTKDWFYKLQNIICDNIEKFEKEYGSKIKFKKNKWKHGEFRIIRGKVIEKGGVAFSNVVGKFPKEFAKPAKAVIKDHKKIPSVILGVNAGNGEWIGWLIAAGRYRENRESGI